MRNGLIPNAFATVEDAAIDLKAPVPSAGLRAHLRRRAALLDDIQQAATRGDENAVLASAEYLRIVRHHTPFHAAA